MAGYKNKRSVDQKMVLFTDILDWVRSLFGSKVCQRVQNVSMRAASCVCVSSSEP